MRKLLLSLTILFVVSATSFAKGPFTWTWRNDADGLTVSLELKKGAYAYLDGFQLFATLPNGSVVQPSVSPETGRHADKEVFAVSPSVWRFDKGLLRYPLMLEVDFQGCEDIFCLMPMKRYAYVSSATGSGAFEIKKPAPPANSSDGFKILRSAVGYKNAAEFNAFLKGGQDEAFAGRSFLALALIALVGGLALNLTPCVLPLIPVNLSIIGAGANEKGRFNSALRGLTYGLGIALCYGALGLASALGGSSFGSLNSTWWFNLGAGVLFLVLALAQFDLFNIDFSRFNAKIPLPSSGLKFAGVFALGAISALLAGACVAPVVIAILLHSATLYAEGMKWGLLLPFLLGVGMAAPWPFAAAGMSFLPKPGRWMMRVKQALGVLIALLAVYYVWTGISLMSTSSGEAGDTSPAAQLAKLDAAFEASKADGRPVLIDFQASWCKNCEFMELTTFRDASVKKELEAFHLVKFQAENPDNALIRPVLERYGIIGLPSYVILGAGQ